MPVIGDPVPRTVLKATRPWRSVYGDRLAMPSLNLSDSDLRARANPSISAPPMLHRCRHATLCPPLDGDIDLILQRRPSSSAVVPDFVRATRSFIARLLPTAPLTPTASSRPHAS
ncbi:hypothetical protein K438DRAFT_2017757 [Mycena galopus ATCC 62051]|nr:hypothetical protein K438DRAFT_2017757 [Mycena galopus ATCC 62051]